MKNKIKTGLGVVFIATAIVNTGFAEDSDWHLHKDKDGIKVYNRTVEGNELKEVKATARVQAPLTAVIALLEDDAKVCEWLSKCMEFRTIEQNAEGKFFYLWNYYPPPFAHRDVVLYRSRKEEPQPQSVTYTFTGAQGKMPPQEKKERIKSLRLEWRFTSNGNETRIELEFYQDPGGRIPKWLVNRGTLIAVFNSLKRFQRLVR